MIMYLQVWLHVITLGKLFVQPVCHKTVFPITGYWVVGTSIGSYIGRSIGCISYSSVWEFAGRGSLPDARDLNFFLANGLVKKKQRHRTFYSLQNYRIMELSCMIMCPGSMWLWGLILIKDMWWETCGA